MDESARILKLILNDAVITASLGYNTGILVNKALNHELNHHRQTGYQSNDKRGDFPSGIDQFC